MAPPCASPEAGLFVAAMSDVRPEQASKRTSVEHSIFTGSRPDRIMIRGRAAGITVALFQAALFQAATIQAVLAAFNPSRASTASRITNFWIFPVTVIGNSS